MSSLTHSCEINVNYNAAVFFLCGWRLSFVNHKDISLFLTQVSFSTRGILENLWNNSLLWLLLITGNFFFGYFIRKTSSKAKCSRPKRQFGLKLVENSCFNLNNLLNATPMLFCDLYMANLQEIDVGYYLFDFYEIDCLKLKF